MKSGQLKNKENNIFIDRCLAWSLNMFQNCSVWLSPYCLLGYRSCRMVSHACS